MKVVKDTVIILINIYVFVTLNEKLSQILVELLNNIHIISLFEKDIHLTKKNAEYELLTVKNSLLRVDILNKSNMIMDNIVLFEDLFSKETYGRICKIHGDNYDLKRINQIHSTLKTSLLYIHRLNYDLINLLIKLTTT